MILRPKLSLIPTCHATLVAAIALVSVGCDVQIEHFQPNKVYALTIARARSTATDEALRVTAREAIKRKAGARGLRSILEGAMLDIMYEVPYLEGITECVVTAEVITDGAEPLLTFLAATAVVAIQSQMAVQW